MTRKAKRYWEWAFIIMSVPMLFFVLFNLEKLGHWYEDWGPYRAVTRKGLVK